jgi:hypothetical protein
MYIRFLLSILLVIIYTFSVSAHADHGLHALKYSEQKKWDKAIIETNKVSDPVIRKIIYGRRFLDTNYK